LHKHGVVEENDQSESNCRECESVVRCSILHTSITKRDLLMCEVIFSGDGDLINPLFQTYVNITGVLNYARLARLAIGLVDLLLIADVMSILCWSY
jgi:hypothetical protein